MVITGNPADVASAYVKARSEIQTLLVKDGKANRSTYPTLAGILATITPTLIAHGLVLMQETTSNEFGVGVSTTILHQSGASIDFAPLTMQPADLKPQTVGSTISYCRRYSLISALGLVGGIEDDDGEKGTFGSKAPQATGDYHDESPWDTFDALPAGASSSTRHNGGQTSKPAAHNKQPDTVSVDQMNRITELGSAVYGDQFGANAGKLAEFASQGARKTLAALKLQEGEKLIRSLEKKIKEKQLSESHRSQINGIAA